MNHFSSRSNVASNMINSSASMTADEWIELSQKVHGGFGSYISLGIRIGLDAVNRLDARPRDLDVTYYNSSSAPCLCIIDGIMIATVATPGQNSLRVASTPSGRETLGTVVIRNHRTQQALRYIIPISAQVWLDQWNCDTSERERYELVITAPEADLFAVEKMS